VSAGRPTRTGPTSPRRLVCAPAAMGSSLYRRSLRERSLSPWLFPLGYTGSDCSCHVTAAAGPIVSSSLRNVGETREILGCWPKTPSAPRFSTAQGFLPGAGPWRCSWRW
jgi:hypothetical protein